MGKAYNTLNVPHYRGVTPPLKKEQNGYETELYMMKSKEYLFIAIISKSTLTQNSNSY